MPFQVTCPDCGCALRVPDELVGQEVKCPSCSRQFAAPAADEGQTLKPEDRVRAAGDIGREQDALAARSHEEHVREEPGAHRPPPLPRFDDYEDDDLDDDLEFRRRRRRGPRLEEIRSRVAGPANGLIAVGIIGVVLTLIGILSNLANVGNRNADEVVIMLAVGTGLFHLVISSLIIMAAQKMKKLESIGFARTMAIIAMIPMISPCCLLGLIFGSQATSLLGDPEVKAAFR
jgi:hypothetical protein